jgi:hypothetical protein
VSLFPIGATEGGVVTPHFDTFGQKAPKLSVLLGQSPTARVLLIGSALKDWKDDFAHYFVHLIDPVSSSELESVLEDEGSFDLIVLACTGKEAERLYAIGSFDRLRSALSPSGTLFFVAENRLSLTQLALNPFSVLGAGKTTAPACRFRLRHAGFERVEEFLPLPRLLNAEEFVSSSHGSAVVPSDVSAIEMALDKAGLLSMFHEGWAYIASGPQGGTFAFLEKIATPLRPVLNGQPEVLLERFDLRNRGALVLLLRSRSGRRRFVCRITTGDLTDRSVRRNAEWTARVHQSPLICAAVKAAVPKPVASFVVHPGTAYLEDLIEGTIAWKLAGKAGLDAVMLVAMFQFIKQFNRDTAVETVFDENTFDQLVRSAHEFSVDDETARRMTALEARLRQRILGTRRLLVWAHGDFGYGNAIADPQTGQVRGIIDWDQARHDLSGVDLLNFLLLREHSRRDIPMASLLEEIAKRFVTGGFHAINPRLDYETDFATGEPSRVDLLGLVALRIAQRVAIYPALFQQSRAETHTLLEWACDALA